MFTPLEETLFRHARMRPLLVMTNIITLALVLALP